MSKNFTAYEMVASGTVDGATGLLEADGGVAGAVVERNGPGDYTILLPGGGISELECVILLTPKGTIASGNVQPPAIEHASDTEKYARFEVFGGDGNVPTDMDFMFAVFRGYDRHD